MENLNKTLKCGREQYLDKNFTLNPITSSLLEAQKKKI